MLYIRKDKPSKLLAIVHITEAFFVEINLHLQKWLVSCSYNPKKALISNHMAILSKNTDIYTTKYDNSLFWRGFNAGLEDTSMKKNCLEYGLIDRFIKFS